MASGPSQKKVLCRVQRPAHASLLRSSPPRGVFAPLRSALIKNLTGMQIYLVTVTGNMKNV